MIDWLVRRPLVAALAGVAALLVVAVALEVGTGNAGADAAKAPGKAAASPDAKLLPPVVTQAPEQAYPEMAARPLFTPTRRPAPAEPNQGKQSFARGQFVLQGVIVVGDQRTALLKEKSTGKVHRVDRGKDLNGILVERVEPTEVVLASGDERERIALVVQKPETGARAPGATESHDGPFGVQTAAQPAAAPTATATPGAAAPPGANPLARPAPAAANPNAAQPPLPPTAQPMTPEELLARRRARRNQPTQ